MPPKPKLVRYDLRIQTITPSPVNVIFRGTEITVQAKLRILVDPPAAANNFILGSFGPVKIPKFSAKFLKKGDNSIQLIKFIAPNKSGDYTLHLEFWAREKNVFGVLGKSIVRAIAEQDGIRILGR